MTGFLIVMELEMELERHSLTKSEAEKKAETIKTNQSEADTLYRGEETMRAIMTVQYRW